MDPETKQPEPGSKPSEPETPPATVEVAPPAEPPKEPEAPEVEAPAPPAPSNFRAGGPLNPSLNEDLHDSLGKPKTIEDEKGNQVAIAAPQPIGPRGANVPPEHLSEGKKAETAAAEAKRLQQGMSSTDLVDSRGKKQGEFKVEPQGLDKHGARIPDKVTDELVDPPPAMVGPRGKDAPPETYHGKKPASGQR